MGARPKWAIQARMEVLQGMTGAFLTAVGVVYLHLQLSILFGAAAFNRIADTLAGNALAFVFWIAVAGALLLHVRAVGAKIPHQWANYKQLFHYTKRIAHGGTRLWLAQLFSGLALLMLLPLWGGMLYWHWGEINAQSTAYRIAWQGGWLLYATLLPLLVVHGIAGITRMWLKWCPIAEPRFAGRRLMRAFAIYLMVLGMGLLGWHVGAGHALHALG